MIAVCLFLSTICYTVQREKRKTKVISESLEKLFQSKLNFPSSLQGCLIYIKLCPLGFSSLGDV